MSGKQWLLLLAFLWSSIITGQERDRFEPKVDIGVNVTSILSSFSGNGNFLNPQDLPVFIRISRNNPNIRIGLGANSASSEFIDPISSSIRKSTSQEFYGKLGFELNSEVTKKWTAFYGIDLIFNYQAERVKVAGVNTILQNTYAAGVSCFFGYKYFLTDRLYFSTEANFSLVYDFEKTEQVGQEPRDVSGESYSINPPLFFYFNYRL